MMLRNTQSGFSLIEVMVAAFIFATGILGLAGLQMKSLGMLSNSHSMGFATIAAADMVDRMHANPVAVFDGFYDDIEQDLNDRIEDPECGTDCSAREIAQYDAFAVFELLDGELTEPTISVLNAGNNIFTITVTWQERIGTNEIATKLHRVSFFPYKP